MRLESVARLSGWSVIITRLARRQLTTSSLNRQQQYYSLPYKKNQYLFAMFLNFFSPFFLRKNPQTLHLLVFASDRLKHVAECVHDFRLFHLLPPETRENPCFSPANPPFSVLSRSKNNTRFPACLYSMVNLHKNRPLPCLSRFVLFLFLFVTFLHRTIFSLHEKRPEKCSGLIVASARTPQSPDGDSSPPPQSARPPLRHIRHVWFP